MDMPVFGKINLEPEVIEAVRSAIQHPCAICGESEGLVVRQLIPRKPQLFPIPEKAAIYLPLCGQCKHIDAVTLEAFLLACQLYQDWMAQDSWV